MGPVSGVVRNAGRRLPSVFEAEPQLHASIFDEVVSLGPRADAGAPIYDERHCINTNTNTKYTCDTGQTRNKLLEQWVHLTVYKTLANR